MSLLNRGVWLGLALSLLACGGEEGIEQAPAGMVGGKADGGGQVIRLVYADAWTHSKYGYSTRDKRFVIEVRNLAFDKRVAVAYRSKDGGWHEIAASYVRPAARDTELWEARYSGEDFDRQFALRYDVAGQTYWDNNGGRDYALGDNDGVMLGSDVNVRLNSAYAYQGSSPLFNGIIDVRNLAYAKRVQVVYSFDGFATAHQLDATYLGWWRNYGYAGTQNPNVQGIEGWQFNLTQPAGDFNDMTFYVLYEVDGQRFVDDNDGALYRPFTVRN